MENTHHFHAAAVRQTEVADQQVERLRFRHFKGGAHRNGRRHIVSPFLEQFCQNPQGVRVILHEQYPLPWDICACGWGG